MTSDASSGQGSVFHRGTANDLIIRAKLPGPQKLILMGYLSHFGSDRDLRQATAWPSVDLLCCYSSTGAKTTSAHRQQLVDAGILVVVRIRPGNVPECRIDFDALESAGPAERGQSVDPGNRGGRFGKDCGSAKTAEPQRLPKRFGKDCGSGSAKTADEPSPRTLPKNPPHSVGSSAPAEPAPPREGQHWSTGLRWVPAHRGGHDRRRVAEVALRVVHVITGRPCKAMGLDGEGRDIVPQQAKTAAAPVLKLLSALDWPDLDEFEASARLVAEAARSSDEPLFARDIRGEGWAEGRDRSREVDTLLRHDRWDKRLDAAQASVRPASTRPVEVITNPEAWVAERFAGLLEGWQRATAEDPQNPHGLFDRMLRQRVDKPRDVAAAFRRARLQRERDQRTGRAS